MAIPPIKETYLDRLLTDEEAVGLPNILNLDPDVNVKRGDYRSLSDAYNYYLGGGLDASQADFPIPASGESAGITATDVIRSPEQNYQAYLDLVENTGLKEPYDGKTTTYTSPLIETSPTVEQIAAMEDIGAIPSIVQDPMTGDASIAEAIAAQNRQDALTARMPTDYEAEAYGAPDTIASLQNVTPEAQGAWQKVQSGLASAGDFIQNYGMATYNFLAGNIGAGLAGLATGPLGLGFTAAASAFQTTPEQKAMQSAAQAAGIADPSDPRKDIYGKNIVSVFGDYDQSVADSIATIEETARKKGGEDNLAPNLKKKLADLKNYQNEKAWEDVDTDMAQDTARTTRDDAIGAGIAAADDDSGADMFEPTAFTTLPGGYELPADERDLGRKTTALDLAEGNVSMDEFGNFYNAAGNIIDDPRKTETDIAIASGETVGEKLTAGFQRELDSLQSQVDVINEMPISDEEKQKMIDQAGLEKAIEDIKNQIKGVKSKTPKVQESSLVDLTDTGGDDIIDRPTVEDVAATEDINITPTTPTRPPANIGVDRAGSGADVSGPSKTTSASTSDGGFGDTSGPRGGRNETSAPAKSSPSKSPGHPSNRGGGGGSGGGGGCFLKGTPITMADGSTKPVEQVDLGDKVAEGGKVFAAGRFLTEELHDYEGIKVSGSHMVNENDTWVRVRDSKKGKPLGDDEHTVYVFGAENRRILINDILFTDYFEVKEQDQLSIIGNKYFDQWGVYAKNDDINNVNTLNAI